MKKFMLTVPEPCHENWEAMTPEDKGRFCMACQKTVVDFTDKTDRELGLFFKKKTEAVCGRFNTSQLDKVLAVPPQPLPFLKYAAAMALPAFLLSCEGHTQGEIQIKEPTSIRQLQGDTLLMPIDSTKKPHETRSIKGRTITRTVEKQKFHIITIVKDLYCFPQPPFTYNIDKISKVSRENLANENTQFITAGLVSMTPIRATIKKEIPNHTKPPSFVKSPFTVYPNPALANSYIKLDVSQLKEGEYNLSIANSMGEVVDTQKVIIKKETPTVGITLKQLMAGPYFVYLTNSKTTKSYSEILIVQ